MAGMSIGGLASGLDTAGLVKQLMQVESRGKSRLEWNKALWNARKDIWSQLNVKLQGFQTSVNSLIGAGSWSSDVAATSSNEGKVSAAVTGAAPAAGSYEVTVSQLAALGRWESAGTGVVNVAQDLSIRVNGTTAQVSLMAGDDVATVAQRINDDPATSGLVTASVSGDGRLLVTSNVNGSAGAIEMWSSVGGTDDYIQSNGLYEAQTANNSIFHLNGQLHQRTTNTITGLINDVTLELNDLAANPVTINVTDGSVDAASVKARIMDFVEKYNATIDYINLKSGEDRIPDAKNAQQHVQGAMSRDFGFTSIGFDLRRAITTPVDGVAGQYSSLDMVGITTGPVSGSYSASGVAGKLHVDEAKLDAALAADPMAVRELFVKDGGTAKEDGIGRRMSDLVAQMRVGGRVDSSIQGATSQIQNVQSSIDRFEFRLERKREYYERMFAQLESVLGKMQSQSAWMSQQIANL